MLYFGVVVFTSLSDRSIYEDIRHHLKATLQSILTMTALRHLHKQLQERKTFMDNIMLHFVGHDDDRGAGLHSLYHFPIVCRQHVVHGFTEHECHTVKMQERGSVFHDGARHHHEDIARTNVVVLHVDIDTCTLVFAENGKEETCANGHVVEGYQALLDYEPIILLQCHTIIGQSARKIQASFQLGKRGE